MTETGQVVTGVLGLVAPVPLVLFGGMFGHLYDFQFLILDAFTVSLVVAAFVGFLNARRWRLPGAILATTLYGVFAGTEWAAAAFLAPYGSSSLLAVPFGLLVLPAAVATYLLHDEWLRSLAVATSAPAWAVRRVAKRLGMVYAGYAALEGFGFLALFIQYTAPCAGAGGSQTSCSSPQELAAMGAIGLVPVVPIVVAFTLGKLLEQHRNALVRSAGPPPTGL